MALCFNRPMSDQGNPEKYDVVVVGAGMAGIYLLKRLRDAGFAAVALEAADDVGGTWYWNRYPGCALRHPESLDYSVQVRIPSSPTSGSGPRSYATQPEILRYLSVRCGHATNVRSRHPLRDPRHRRDQWNDDTGRCGTSRPSRPAKDGEGARSPAATTSWPRAACRFRRSPTSRARSASRATSTSPAAGRTRKSTSPASGVAVIGTGSSGIQSIPLIAEQADRDELVFPAHAQLLHARRQRSRSPPTSAQAVESRSAKYSRRGALVRAGVVAGEIADRGRLQPSTRKSVGAAFEQSPGSRVSCWPPASSSTTSPSTPRRQRAFGRVHPRQDPLRRRRPGDRRAAVPDGATPSAPSARVSTPTTSRPSTCPTSASSTCTPTPIQTITENGIDLRRRRTTRVASTSTPSSTPPASTP